MKSSQRGQLEQRLLVLVTLGLVAFGLVMVYSATSAAAALGNGDPVTFLKRQGVYALAGVALMLARLALRPPAAAALAPPLVLAALVLCVVVLVVAPEINGAKRWLSAGPLTFQPSELAKLALLDLGRRLPRAQRRAADARRALEADRAAGVRRSRA